MNLKNKKILITGATGFIGSLLTERLVKEGCKVKALAIDNFNSLKHLKSRITIIKRDLSLPLKSVLKNIDVVFHLAALTDRTGCIKNPERAFKINTYGTFNLLKALTHYETKKFIYLNTAAVYGVPEYIPIDEKHPTVSINPYSASKLAGENYVIAFGSTYNLDYSIIRLFNVYGPGQNINFVLPTIIKQVIKKNYIKLENVNATRDFIYIDDVIDGIIKVAKKAKKEIYNMGSGKEISIKMALEEIMNICNKKVVINTDEINKSKIIRSCADISKIKKELNWRPKIGFHEGLKKTIKWYKNEFNSE